MKKKFKSIAIYSSISSSKVSQIALQLEEIINNLGLKKIIPASSSIKTNSKIKKHTDKYIIEKRKK